MAASATFALKVGVWFRRGRLFMVSPDSLGTACPLSGRNSTYRPVQIFETSSMGDPEWRVSTDYLLTHVLDLPKERQTNNHTKRVASLMRGLGWHRHETPMRIGSGVARGFIRKNAM